MDLSTARLRRHLLEELLPYWAERGVDRARGGYFSRLGPGGRALADEPKRLRVHTRQIYAFSEGARMGARWALEPAAHGMAFLERAFRDRTHGGWFQSTTPEGAPQKRTKDAYDHAFVVLALATYADAAGDRASLALARETAALVPVKLGDARHGGYREAANEDWTARNELPRRQNPHMHWLEALLALHAVAPDAVLLAEAERIVSLLRTRWFDAAHGALGEFFAEDWTPLRGADGEVVEPGHHYEWAWLLARLAEASGAGADPIADALFEFAERHGLDANGGVFDRVDRRGALVAATKRLWPQTERLKALAARGARKPLESALVALFARYARHDGGWTEHVDRAGRPLDDVQNATSVYHVVLALREAIAALEGAVTE